MQKDWLPPLGTRLGATFYVRQSQPWLKHYFGVDELEPTWAPGIGGVVRWGGRVPAKTASLVAGLRGLPVWYLEDGFLRSVGLGKAMTLPISVAADDLGMPIDASKPSRLERLIGAAAASGADALGSDIRNAIVHHRLSKYNNLPHREPKLEKTTRRRILLVDQVLGDVSVPLAGGSRHSFARMLEDGMRSGAQCIVRTHPDVMAGFRKGYMTEAAARMSEVVLMADAVSVASVLGVVDEVWTVSSQFGLDALLRDIPVRCYASPFYAGWGLTDDRLEGEAASALHRRQAKPNVDELTAAAFAFYPSYRDRTTWEELDVFGAIDRLVEERRQLAID